MDFTLTDDQKMLADAVASLAKKESTVERVRKIRSNDAGWDRKVWRHMGELGWLGVALPEAAGGLGGTLVDAGLIVEKLGATLVPEPYVPSVVVTGLAIAQSGTDEQMQKYLTPIIPRASLLALTYSQSGIRHEASQATTRQERAG